jgi:hypothetical protein
MGIVAYQIKQTGNKVKVENSREDKVTSSDLDAVMSCLLEPYDQCMKVVWDLDAAIAPVLKLFGEKACHKLLKEKRATCYPYKLFYVPDKVFWAEHIPTKTQSSFYQLLQFAPDKIEPQTIGELAGLGIELVEALKSMGMNPKKLSSPIAVYEESIMKHLNLPTIKDIPKEAAQAAYEASGKLWIEAYQIGHWDKSYDYDLKNSFPSEMMQLVDFRHCKWIESKEYREDAIYGYARCKVSMEAEVHPIVYVDREGNSSCPRGKWQRTLTKKQMAHLDKYRTGHYEITAGYWAIPKYKSSSTPLEVPIRRVLQYRAREPLRALLAKRICTGIYGKTGEVRANEAGEYLNPVWFAETSTNVALKVAEFIYEHKLEDNVIHCSVDGVLVDRPVEQISPEWKLDSDGESIVISDGLVYNTDKHPQGFTLESIKKLIKQHPRQGYYSQDFEQVVTLGHGANLGFSKVGSTAMFRSTIDFGNLNPDREFSKLPKNGEQLMNNQYRSKAKVINE